MLELGEKSKSITKNFKVCKQSKSINFLYMVKMQLIHTKRQEGQTG